MRFNPFMEFPFCQIMPSSILPASLTADLFMSPLTAAPRSTSQKRYLVSCLICGSFSFLLGAMFFGVYYLIRSYTLNGYFETVPIYVPATLLIVTGMSILSFAKRTNRYSCMIYFCGISSAVSAIICAAVTVTTKILHMSRLQDLNLNCEYKITTRICTCFSDYENHQDEGKKFLFDAVADCRVAQSDLYSCLQAIFGLSIAGVLVAVFSCMLSYLLFSHERKKFYWEQLDMRFRLLHASHYNSQTPLINSHYHHHNNCQQQHPNNNNLYTNNRACGFCENCFVTNAGLPRYPYTHQIFNTTNHQQSWNENYINACQSKYLTNNRQNAYCNFYGNNLNQIETNATNNELSQNNISGRRWPRLPWQRNLVLQSLEQARLSSRETTDCHGWNEFFGSPQCIGGYPIGMWGPPPPPYSDNNNVNLNGANSSGESAHNNNNSNNFSNSGSIQSVQFLEYGESNITNSVNDNVEMTSIPENYNK